jgi:hypothetical protein
MHFSSYIDRFIAYAQSRLMGLHPLGEGDSRRGSEAIAATVRFQPTFSLDSGRTAVERT